MYLDYLQSPGIYLAKLKVLNPILEGRFGWLYRKLEAVLADELGGPVAYRPGRALPGFHILAGSDRLKKPGGIHCDGQYRHVDWGSGADLSKPASFTLSIALPASGAGLNYWDLRFSDVPSGLPPADFEKEFEPFRKAPPSLLGWPRRGPPRRVLPSDRHHPRRGRVGRTDHAARACGALRRRMGALLVTPMGGRIVGQSLATAAEAPRKARRPASGLQPGPVRPRRRRSPADPAPISARGPAARVRHPRPANNRYGFFSPTVGNQGRVRFVLKTAAVRDDGDRFRGGPRRRDCPPRIHGGPGVRRVRPAGPGLGGRHVPPPPRGGRGRHPPRGFRRPFDGAVQGRRPARVAKVYRRAFARG